MSAIVVGAGIGGLVVAGRLAREGVRVTLLEQNEQVRPVLCAGTPTVPTRVPRGITLEASGMQVPWHALAC